MNKMDIVQKVQEILKSHCDDPADQIIMEAQALLSVGKALKGLSLQDARAVIRAVAELQ